ncbi:MAG: MFS transporter [Actinomycetota bacterium]|nr:MFS transporter [Actinomycetota bacterium]
MTGDRHPYRWVVFGGVAGVYFGFGVVAASIAPVVGEIRADLGLSRSAMGLALGAWQLVYIVTAPVGGRLVDRWGLRWSLTAGAGIVIVSGLARATASDLTTLWLAVALFGVGGPLISACAPTAVALWFGDGRERRLAVGAYTAAPAVGGIGVLVLSNSVLMPLTGSWRWTMVIETGAIAIALLVWLFLSARAPEPPGAAEISTSGGSGWRDLLARSEFRLILILGLVVFFLTHGLGGWMPEILREHSGFSAMAAANWVAVGGVVGIGASLFLPRWGDYRRLPSMLIGLSVVVAAALVAIATLPAGFDPLFVGLLGVRSAIIPLTILALMEAPSVGPQNMGTAYGLWFAVAEVGGVTGPLAMGRIGDSTAGFGGALISMACVCGVVILLAGRLRVIRGATVSSDRP